MLDDRTGQVGSEFPEMLAPLTGVRFFLALGVVLFHYQLHWTLPPEAAGLLNRARLGVDVFFILSGFIMAHVYLRDGRPLNYPKFLAARFARIYPAHLFILVAMLALVLTAPLLGVGLEPGRFNAGDFVQTLVLVQAWFPRQSLALWNGPAWSLSAEWFAYLAFPIYAWIGLRWKARPWALITLATVLFVVIDAVYHARYGIVLPRAEDNMGVLRIIPEFLYGVGLYQLGRRWGVVPRIAGSVAVTSSVVFLGLMQVGADDRLIVASAGPFLLSLALLAKAGVRSFLSAPVVLLGGEASFALYLVHIPVLMVWRNAAQAIVDLPGDYRMSPPELAGLLLVTLTVALLIHLWIEQPGREVLRRLLIRSSKPSQAR
ncbi:acyltransferase [Actinomadura yumaensis]